MLAYIITGGFVGEGVKLTRTLEARLAVCCQLGLARDNSRER